MRVSLRTLPCTNLYRLVHPAWLLVWMGVAACGQVVLMVTEEDAMWEASAEVAVGSGVARRGACWWLLRGCYVFSACLEIDPRDHRAWHGLGTQDGGYVSGTLYFAKDCYVKCFEIDPRYHQAWHGLGRKGGGKVSGTSYSAKDCYAKCFEIDPRYHQAWHNLGRKGGGKVSGTSYSAKDCYEKAKIERLALF